MTFSIQWLDTTPFVESGRQPVVSIVRPKLDRDPVYGKNAAHYGEFWVPENAVNADKIDWSITKLGELVRIPLFAYRTTGQSKSLLMACGLEMGMRAATAFIDKSQCWPHEVKLIVGTRCDVMDGVYRYYFGMAIMLEPK